ncbi:MAG: FHA domain-containing protein [Planctomycetales bacterium]|nr:FHA domain-containing protein [Planctomycetales bacterium]
MSTASSTLEQVRISVIDPKGGRREYQLADGGTLMVGSGANCGVRLDDPKIASIHCLLRLREGEFEVQDWCSQLGTYVDGERIEDEATVQPGTDLRIGEFILAIRSDNSAPQAAPPKVNSCCGSGARSPLTVEDPAPCPTAPTAATTIKTTAESTPPGEENPTPPTASSIPDTPTAATEPPPAAPQPAPKPAAAKSRPAPTQRPPQHEVFDAETVNILRAEIECLQTELTERDRQLAELADLADDNFTSSQEVTDSVEVEKLVARLESLLDELERNDQRTRALEELLRAEQELVRHQEEERSQIERWIGELEQRVATREQEWNAEKSVLSQRIEQLRQERDIADRHLQAQHSDEDTRRLQETVVADLRSELDQLKEELERSRQATQTAVAEIATLKERSPESYAREQIEEAVRAERLALAQERAALSRERAEVARTSAKEENTTTDNKRHCEADERFHAFRQTLKEIHEEELSRDAPQRKPTLGSRIADLWRRLDGPTDTD